jgi:lipopolysaccharide exporter
LAPNSIITDRLLATADQPRKHGPGFQTVSVAGLAKRWRFLRNAATLSLGTLVAQGINVLLAPVLTRLYSPADLGILGLFTSFLSVVSVAASLKFEMGIVSAHDNHEAAQLTWASVLLCIPTAIFFSVILHLGTRFSHFGLGALPRYAVPLMALAIVLTGTFNSLRYLALREENFNVIARTTVAQQTTRAFSQTGFGFLRFGPAGLLVGELVGRAAGIFSLVRRQWRCLQQGVRAAPAKMIATLQRNRAFPVYSLPSSFIDALALNILVPILVQLYGPEAGGQFSLVLRALAVPTVLIGASVADSFHSRLAIYAREDPAKMAPFFTRTALGLFLAGLGPAAVIALAGRQIFSFIFGPAWATAGTLAAISVPFFLSSITVSPLSRLVFVLHGQRSKLLYDVFLLFSILLAYRLAFVHKFSLTQTVWAFSLINTLGFILYFMVLMRIIRGADRIARKS